jgi:hypothetical protein
MIDINLNDNNIYIVILIIPRVTVLAERLIFLKVSILSGQISSTA